MINISVSISAILGVSKEKDNVEAPILSTLFIEVCSRVVVIGNINVFMRIFKVCTRVWGMKWAKNSSFSVVRLDRRA